MKRRVLILCTGNSCRSQMAEALWRKLAGKSWECRSAGTDPAGFVHPLALAVMAEVGIDLTAQRSKHLSELANESFNLAVTVCDAAREACPVVPGAKQTLHWPFEDPARAEGNEEQRLELFRTTRDRIAARIERYLQGDAVEQG